MDLKEFQNSRQGKKIQKQILAAWKHIQEELGYARKLIDLDKKQYLTVEDGKIVLRYMNTGANLYQEEMGVH